MNRTLRNTPLLQRLAAGAALFIVLAGAALHGAAHATDVINLKGPEARRTLDDMLARIKATPGDIEAQKSAGILLHQINRTSPSKEGVEQGERLLKAASTANPKDAETLAWLGSITTMKALFETDPGKQTFFVKMGTRLMDSAVQQAPENLVVRLIRANNSLELPAFMNRTRFAIEDFQRYLSLCEGKSCPAADVQAARAGLAAAQKRQAEAT